MKNMTVRNADEFTLQDLYSLFNEAIDVAASMKNLWATRARAACANCVNVLRQFARGEVTTDDVKVQFKTMTTLFHEVVMSDAEAKAVLCLAEVAHAAAHLGHLATSMSHGGKTHREYDSLQKAYVVFGLEGSKRYAAELHKFSVSRRDC
jgi:hypothetical protein